MTFFVVRSQSCSSNTTYFNVSLSLLVFTEVHPKRSGFIEGFIEKFIESSSKSSSKVHRKFIEVHWTPSSSEFIERFIEVHRKVHRVSLKFIENAVGSSKVHRVIGFIEAKWFIEGAVGSSSGSSSTFRVHRERSGFIEWFIETCWFIESSSKVRLVHRKFIESSSRGSSGAYWFIEKRSGFIVINSWK